MIVSFPIKNKLDKDSEQTRPNSSSLIKKGCSLFSATNDIFLSRRRTDKKTNLC